MSEHAFYVESSYTLSEHLWFKLFPGKYCPLPEAPASYRDCLVIRTTVVMGLLDRLRVLFSGCLIVETKTVTENIVGATITSSISFPIKGVK